MDDLFFLEAKCVKTDKRFYIRFDKGADGVWRQTYGLTHIPDGVGKTSVGTSLDISETETIAQYKCPYCGNRSIIYCHRCEKITCHDGSSEYAKCAHCGNERKIEGTIKRVKGSSRGGQ